MTEKLEYVCGSCDFNYRVVDEHGLMDYCAVLEFYEDEMREVKSCPQYRFNQGYDTD